MLRSRVLPLAIAAIGILLVGACARQGAPPGGPEDLRPPLVLSVTPDTFAIVEPGAGKLRIRFNERISERPESGTLNDAVTISPRTGDVRVSHNREGLEVELDGGFKANTVYRVTVAPVLRDMFNNPMVVPFEWVFSTGPAFEENAIAGLAFDRVSGEGVAGATLTARRVGADGAVDSIPQIAPVDEDGYFALRWLAAGEWIVEAFLDRDRDGVRQAEEAGGSERVTVGTGGVAADTATSLIRVLQVDTTSARIAQTEFVDSTAIRVAFDDYLDPGVPLETVAVGLSVDQALVDSILADEPNPTLAEAVARARALMPGVVRIFNDEAWTEREDSLRAVRARSALSEEAPDSTAEGEPVPEADSPAQPEEEEDEADDDEEELLPDGTPFPVQGFHVLFSGPIPAQVPLRLQLNGIWNVNGLAGNPSVAVRRVPPPPDTVSVDSLAADSAAVGDSIGGGAAVVLDTGGIVADTGGVAADTGGVALRPRPIRLEPVGRRR